MRSTRITVVTGWILVVLSGLMFVMAGAAKLQGTGSIEMFAAWGYPAWFARFIGVAEVAGGIGLIIPRTTRLAILGLTAIMLGAAYTHLANGEFTEVSRPVIFLAVIWTIWRLRRPRRVASVLQRGES